jgi:hypothetical protein
MISDSSYDIEDTILPPSSGVLAGLVASLAMTIPVVLLQTFSGLPLTMIFARIGSFAMPDSLEKQATLLVSTGIMIHGGMGMLWGLFYAMCQTRIPPRILFVVGFFYGFILWVGSTVLFGWLMDETLRSSLRSWPWLLASLIYGLCLAAVAFWVEVRRPVETMQAVPLD